MITINEPKKLVARLAIYFIMARSILCVPFIALHLAADGKALGRFAKLASIPFLLVIAYAIFSLNNGNGTKEVVGQSRDMLLAFTVFCFLSSIPRKLGADALAYRAIRNGAVFIALAKIGVIIAGIVTGMNPLIIVKMISKIWDIQLMTMGVDNSFLTRLQIPIDSATPLLMYVLFAEMLLKRQGRIRNTVYFILLLISLLLTFSRFFWGIGVLLIGLSLLLNANLQTKISWLLGGALLGYSLYMFTPAGDTIDKVIETRIGQQNTSSDSFRIVQTHALWNEVETAPVMGHGIGYFMPSLIRAQETKYLYENQSLSMIVALGYSGVLIWMGAILMVIFGLCYNKPESRFKNVMLTLLFFSIWVAGGFFNPLLWGASGGVILFFAARHHALTANFTGDVAPVRKPLIIRTARSEA
ncbi:O-antigen ligase family protein [Pantoea sp. A4]|uniref:O-antigen ligase family protein n=1 Tax=Pantoea sp. A4 TaxID=1225184 RepID=UPI000378A9F1|nr:O-antigen ligase family protein [Pantoea sp. A4]